MEKARAWARVENWYMGGVRRLGCGCGRVREPRPGPLEQWVYPGGIPEEYADVDVGLRPIVKGWTSCDR
jgi:hypothetical protein